MTSFGRAKRSLPGWPTVVGGVILILCGTCGSALAYLDPGTGSIVLQSLIAGIIGSAALARMYWHRLKALFQRALDLNQREKDSESK
jgi:hypothetical protein